MDRFAKLVIGAGLLSAACAHAGYAWPADPNGFVRGGSWGSGFGYAAAANDSVFGKVIHQQNGLKMQVGGRAVTMPVSYRLAQNAPRIAAQAIFLHPGIRTAVGVASWLGVGKMIWDEAEGIWREIGSKQIGEGGKLWIASILENREGWSVWQVTKDAACAAAVNYRNSMQNVGSSSYNVYKFVRVSNNDCIGSRDFYVGGILQFTDTQYDSLVSKNQSSAECPEGWTDTPAGCLSPALSQPQFVDKVGSSSMPETVPKELPYPTPLPVEPSPGPWINPEPGTNPQHRPMFVPTGDPVPNPNYDPDAAPSPQNQPYIQPGIRVNPSPAPNDPWRVDVQPVDRPKPTPEPMPGSESESNPETGDGDKPRPEETPGLCDLYPDILACVKLDTPDDQDIPASEKPISITPDSGWGPDGGTCPAPKVIMTQGRSIPIPFDLFCTYMQGMRPIIIAMAWLSAAFILIGAREGN